MSAELACRAALHPMLRCSLAIACLEVGIVCLWKHAWKWEMHASWLSFADLGILTDCLIGTE